MLTVWVNLLVIERLSKVVSVIASASGIEIVAVRVKSDDCLVVRPRVAELGTMCLVVRLGMSEWLLNLVVVMRQEMAHDFIRVKVVLLRVNVILVVVELVEWDLVFAFVSRSHLYLHGLLARLGIRDEELLELYWVRRWALWHNGGLTRRAGVVPLRLCLRWLFTLLLLLLLSIPGFQHHTHKVHSLICLVRLAFGFNWLRDVWFLWRSSFRLLFGRISLSLGSRCCRFLWGCGRPLRQFWSGRRHLRFLR